MIGRLSGTLIDPQLDGTCIVDVGGVGYQVQVPVRVWDHLPQAEQRIVLHIHTIVREDVLALYGFLSVEDRTAFRALLGVSKIGPKVALAILGRLSANELAHAVARDDKSAFAKISGVGNKTVERLMIDLKDKLKPVGTVARKTTSAPERATKLGEPTQSVVEALVALGYKRTEAERAACSVTEESEEQSVEVLLREALKAMR